MSYTDINSTVLRPDSTATGTGALEQPAVHQAYRLLHLGFIVAPLLAGADKFFGLMTDWPKYMAAPLDAIIPGTAQQFMYAVGIIEVAASVLVAIKPRIGGYVVAAWLAGIILNLVLQGEYWDVALRDVGLMLGALALARLATVHERSRS